MRATRSCFANGNTAAMMLWAVAGVALGCKELCRAIDQKSLPFHHSDWAGHLMAHVHHTCMKCNDCISPKESPFEPMCSNEFVPENMEECLPVEMTHFDGSAGDNPDSFFASMCLIGRTCFPQMTARLSLCSHRWRMPWSMQKRRRPMSLSQHNQLCPTKNPAWMQRLGTSSQAELIVRQGQFCAWTCH